MCEHKPEELRRRRHAQEPDPALMRALLRNRHFTHTTSNPDHPGHVFPYPVLLYLETSGAIK